MVRSLRGEKEMDNFLQGQGFKILLGAIGMFVGLTFGINGLTGWRDKKQVRKLWIVSGIVTLILLILAHAIF